MTNDNPHTDRRPPATRQYPPARWAPTAVYVIGLLSCLSFLVEYVRDGSWGQVALILIPIGIFIYMLYTEVRDQRRDAGGPPG